MSPAKHLPAREILAVMPPGLEPVVADELASLGWPSPRQHRGTVSCKGSSEQIMRACLLCRTATDLRVRVGRGAAASLEGLAQGLRKLPWQLFLRPGRPLEISVSSHGSRLKRRDVVARKATLAIGDALKGPRVTHRHGRRDPHGEGSPARVYLRIEKDRVEASIDPVGSALWKRGYRARGGAAPLRESLAAAALRAMGWQPGQPLVDPFTGSGTVLIEAAAMTQGVAPGAGRRFDFERWPCHNARSWHRVVNEARSRSKTSPASSMLGSDADQAVLDIARANAKRAGVGSAIRWHHQRIDALEPPTMHPGLVLTNPPWGRRLGARVGGVYTAFGRVLRERFSGWQLGVLCPERTLIRAMRIPLEPRLRFPHGGTELILWAGTVG